MNEFPHYGTFQKYEAERDEIGGYGEETWTDVLTTECFVSAVKSYEFMQAQQMQAPIDHSIFYPYQEGVDASMRFIWHDRGNKVIDLKSSPLDQGGQGEILLVKGQMNES